MTVGTFRTVINEDIYRWTLANRYLEPGVALRRLPCTQADVVTLYISLSVNHNPYRYNPECSRE